LVGLSASAGLPSSRGVLLELLLLDRLSLRDSDFLIFPIFPLLLPPTGPLALVLELPLPPDDAPMSPVLPPPVRRILAPTRRGNQSFFDAGCACAGGKESARWSADVRSDKANDTARGTATGNDFSPGMHRCHCRRPCSPVSSTRTHVWWRKTEAATECWG